MSEDSLVQITSRSQETGVGLDDARRAVATLRPALVSAIVMTTPRHSPVSWL